MLTWRGVSLAMADAPAGCLALTAGDSTPLLEMLAERIRDTFIDMAPALAVELQARQCGA
jgi:hypothetical protein